MHGHGPRTIHVGALTRVEGEGALRVVVDGGAVVSSELQIFEPPRFFEAFLAGRRCTEAGDITARICGICPVAYQTSAANAVEDACGARPGGAIAALRRLLYCGEWISSHALHIHLLHAPDFLGVPDVVALASVDRAAVERGLRIKKAGNAILDLVGGREIHPVNPRTGGFHRAPTAGELAPLGAQLRAAYDDAVASARWVAGFDFPDVTTTARLVAVHHPDHYAIEDGDVATSDGMLFAPPEFLDHVAEQQVPRSTALHAAFDGAPYLTGALARWAVSGPQLPADVRALADDCGLAADCRNPFRSIVIRAVELVYAIGEALRLLAAYERPDPPAVDVAARAGVGHGVSEAPRGLLYHRYELDADGIIRAARIIPPTSQNQAAIEEDLRRVVAGNLDADDATLTALCERAIRNHDPCISCSAHFLELRVERR